ncbi:MAG: hypothetical protein LBG80_16380 [Bacteroidales bacterium]|nr:hypothetical protein [Bacteroidales bacterium]
MFLPKVKAHINTFLYKPKIYISGTLDKLRKEKLLFLVYLNPNGIITIRQTIEEVIKLSSYRIDFLNLYHSYRGALDNIDSYDGIIIHNTLSYRVANILHLERINKRRLRDYHGLKIMMKQDEHYLTDQMAQYLGENGFDLLLTLCDESNVRSFYPEAVTPRLHFMPYLTGFVPSEFKTIRSLPFSERCIDIGYRGSIQPASFGRLAWEKRMIGDAIRQYAEQRGFKTNISSRWEDRFMGNAWLKFLGNCKATLGVESGSDLVDRNGQIEQELNNFIKRNPKVDDKQILEFLAPYEGILCYRAVAPRHFEAAACKTVQIFFEGNYQGIFHANRHFIPLRRDFSNVGEVLDKLRDEQYCINMTECSFEEIIMNHKYSFENFVKKFDEKLEILFREK